MKTRTSNLILLISTLALRCAYGGGSHNGHEDGDDRGRDHGGGKHPSGEVVESLNGLTGQVTLSAGPSITITPAGNSLTFEAQTIVPTSVWNTSGNAGTTAGVNF